MKKPAATSVSRRAAIAGVLSSVIYESFAPAEQASGQTVHGSEADEAAVRKYVENFDHAWNSHDGDALFGVRANEIDRINAMGGWIRNPDADKRVMQRLFAGPFSQSKHTVVAERIRFLTPDVALVVIRMVRISVGPTAGPASAQGNRALHILVKHGGRWELTAFANVPILPPTGPIHDAEGDDVFYTEPKAAKPA